LEGGALATMGRDANVVRAGRSGEALSPLPVLLHSLDVRMTRLSYDACTLQEPIR
jgi:hypothetical protein